MHFNDSVILSPPDEPSSRHYHCESREDDPFIPLDSSSHIAEKQLLRKLDRRILPITCVLYLFTCEIVFKT